MDKNLIDTQSLSSERKSLLPGEGFFILDEVRQQQQEAEIERAISDAKTIVIADPDADGLASVALIRAAADGAALVPVGPHEISDGLEYVAEYGSEAEELFICDLCPDKLAYVTPLEEIGRSIDNVMWFDHHQWESEVETGVREYGVELVVGESDRECTADVVLRSLEYEFPDHLVELAEVTRDHDLWMKEDPRSDDLADYARWVGDEQEYIKTVQEHGPDLPEEVQVLLNERRVEKEDLIERAVRRAEYHDIGPWTVGFTYGRCSQNEVAEAMRSEGADASTIIKPSGAISLRGTDEFERCHEVAGLLNGGGHPKAAGCKPDIYDDMLDYAQHWTTQGAAAKHQVISAFREIAAQERSE